MQHRRRRPGHGLEERCRPVELGRCRAFETAGEGRDDGVAGAGGVAGQPPRSVRAVDVSGVEPMTSVTPMAMKKREDVVTEGGRAADVVANAPETEDNYFLVPKVVE